MTLDTDWKYNSQRRRINAVPATDVANGLSTWETLDLPLFSNTDQYELLHTVVFKCPPSLRVAPNWLPDKGLTWYIGNNTLTFTGEQAGLAECECTVTQLKHNTTSYIIGKTRYTGEFTTVGIYGSFVPIHYKTNYGNSL